MTNTLVWLTWTLGLTIVVGIPLLLSGDVLVSRRRTVTWTEE